MDEQPDIDQDTQASTEPNDNPQTFELPDDVLDVGEPRVVIS